MKLHRIPHIAFLALLVSGFSSAALGKTTVAEARKLPLKVLANRLLGESGALMTELDRPRYPNVLEPLRFYSRAIAWGSFYGVCASDWVTVEFDESGRVEALRSERRFGVAGNVYAQPEKWSYEGFGRICAAVKSTRKFFPAPDHASAMDIVRYVDAISGKGPFAKQTIAYSCAGLCGPNRTDLTWLRLENITSSRAIDCPATSLQLPSCYEIVVGDGRIGPFPKTFRIYGSNYMNRTAVYRITANVASTVQ